MLLLIYGHFMRQTPFSLLVLPSFAWRTEGREEAGYGNPAYGEGGGMWAGTPVPAMRARRERRGQRLRVDPVSRPIFVDNDRDHDAINILSLALHISQQ